MFSSLEGDELKALNVPTWNHVQKTPSMNTSSLNRHSMSLDSTWDDTESSVTTSPTIQPSESQESRRQSKDILRMLHQIEADQLVKNELFNQLGKRKEQCAQIKTDYDEKIAELESHLEIIQLPPKQGLRENRAAQHVRSQYEVKLKRLAADNLDLKKKTAQTSQQLYQVRARSETGIQRLRLERETLEKEKKQLAQQLIKVAGNARTIKAQHEAELLHLKRRMHVAVESKKKSEKANEIESEALQKKTEEMVAATVQLRKLIHSLRKSASEGAMLDESSLDNIFLKHT